MSKLFIDDDVYGRIASAFIQAKGRYIPDLEIIVGNNNLGVMNPCFIHNPVEFSYGFWSLLQYIDERFGPDHRLIPSATPFERSQALSFCNYHLMAEILLPSVRINNRKGSDADIGRIHRAIAEIVKNIGNRSYALGNKLSIVDIFLYTLAGEIKAVFPRGLPPAFMQYVRFINERLQAITTDPNLCWPGDEDSEYDDDDLETDGPDDDGP